jgi:hypothetical protein
MLCAISSIHECAEFAVNVPSMVKRMFVWARLAGLAGLLPLPRLPSRLKRISARKCIGSAASPVMAIMVKVSEAV